MEAVTRATGFARIVRTPGTVGGEPRVRGTRIPVWIIVLANQEYQGDLNQLLQSYPSLDRESASEALAFYDANRDEVIQNMIDNDVELTAREIEKLRGRTDSLSR